MEKIKQNDVALEKDPIKTLNRKSRRQAGAILSADALFYFVVIIAISVLAAMAIKPGMSMLRAYNLAAHLDIINKAVSINYAHSGVYSTLDMDELKQDLPKDWDDGTNVGVAVNPWGGNYTCSVGSVPYIYTCTATNVGVYDSKRIIDNYGSRVVYNPSTKTAVFTYGEV
ncbi:hypothetical protein [Photobacterium sp. GB-72]|uniref:hypothetical protein n=1 Tax=Photobacterium sp. GB-72 TaxID=2022105 RepID=UPI000D15E793|nr:hypothetical protein [Photobacterium sp. GB-72]PSV27668.1 hypothetical protein C9J40_20240 [Photobacterium sp. GB-72]